LADFSRGLFVFDFVIDVEDGTPMLFRLVATFGVSFFELLMFVVGLFTF